VDGIPGNDATVKGNPPEMDMTWQVQYLEGIRSADDSGMRT
jgi:hypothetical protein